MGYPILVFCLANHAYHPLHIVMGAAAYFVAIKQVFKIWIVEPVAHIGSGNGRHKFEEGGQTRYSIHLHAEMRQITAMDNIL